MLHVAGRVLGMLISVYIVEIDLELLGELEPIKIWPWPLPVPEGEEVELQTDHYLSQQKTESTLCVAG